MSPINGGASPDSWLCNLTCGLWCTGYCGVGCVVGGGLLIGATVNASAFSVA